MRASHARGWGRGKGDLWGAGGSGLDVGVLARIVRGGLIFDTWFKKVEGCHSVDRRQSNIQAHPAIVRLWWGVPVLYPLVKPYQIFDNSNFDDDRCV